MIAPAPPRLIAIGGLSGTGKSLLARMLAADVAPLPGAVDAAQRRGAQAAFPSRRHSAARGRCLSARGDGRGL
ncbi:MAG: hypothetical protein MZV49_01935 [Rhodopseudomonas palustris]|nr:hypothetical protein [Rhodopseudomonas palustris]